MHTGEIQMFRRKVYRELKSWKERVQGKYSVLIQGARRVGKSTVAEAFARNEYRSCIIIDFANITPQMEDVFKDIADLNRFFLRLQAETNITLYKRESVIVFDEIQLYPKVRQAIKYLVADGRYDYIETGSLISIKKNIKNIVIPSEEYKINMYPMDYEEFLWATESANDNLIREIVHSGKGLGESTNRKLMRDFRIYMAVGGMPQAVEAYVNGQNFLQIDAIKREIVELYMDDFRKIDQSGYSSKMYQSVPAQLALKKKRYTISRATEKRKTDKDTERLFDLIDSRTVLRCSNVTAPGLSLSQAESETEFKLYLADTGLFTTLLFNDETKVNEDIYRKLLSDKLPENLGYLYENITAQIITASGRKLYYHTWRKENSTHSYEVDFILHNGMKLLPLEVKSSRIRPHASLDEFRLKYSNLVNGEWIISQQDINKDKTVTNWPVYCLPFLLEE